MKYLQIILLSFLLIPESYSRDIIDGSKVGSGEQIGNASSVSGEVWQHCPDESRKSLLAGDFLGRDCFLITSKNSYLRAMLSDNSLFHLGENTAIKVITPKKNEFKIKIEQGQFRLLNFKKSKFIESSLGDYVVNKGEFIWSLGEDAEIGEQFFVVSGVAYKGKERISPTVDLISSHKVRTNQDTGRPWKKYFLGLESSRRPLYQAKFSSRSIASLEGPIESEVSEFEGFLEQEAELPEVKKQIWVHDIVYDVVAEAVESASLKKADEIIPVAIQEACIGLVWDVAHRSVVKWGSKYAYVAGAKEIPQSVASSLKEANVEEISLYDKELFQKSAEEIATIRSYRSAKSAAEIGGYNKGWREAQKYAIELIPEVVLPVVSKIIYQEAKAAGKQAVTKILEKTKLLMTEDVDNLVEHLSQVASQKISMARINKYSAYYAEIAAKKAAREIAKSTSKEIATFVAAKASDTAGKIMQRKIAEKRAKSVARSIASRNKKNEAFKAQSHTTETLRETSR